MPESARVRSLVRKSRLGARIVWWFLVVRVTVRRVPLPMLVRWLCRADGHSELREDPVRLGRAVHRMLRLGARRPTCLVSALVHLRLLRAQGDAAELVIGLPSRATGHSAHAWVEIGALDVGPPPGRAAHEELARFS